MDLYVDSGIVSFARTTSTTLTLPIARHDRFLSKLESAVLSLFISFCLVRRWQPLHGGWDADFYAAYRRRMPRVVCRVLVALGVTLRACGQQPIRGQHTRTAPRYTTTTEDKATSRFKLRSRPLHVREVCRGAARMGRVEQRQSVYSHQPSPH